MRRSHDVSTRRRPRHNSISGDVVHRAPDIQQQPMKQQHKSLVLMSAPNSSLVRKASERSVVCPLINEWKLSEMWCIYGFHDFIIIWTGIFCYFQLHISILLMVVMKLQVNDYDVKLFEDRLPHFLFTLKVPNVKKFLPLKEMLDLPACDIYRIFFKVHCESIISLYFKSWGGVGQLYE